MLYNPKAFRGTKNVFLFFLLENSRPLSPWGPLDYLSICLGTDSLIPPFLGELCCQGKGASFSFHNYFLLKFRGVVPKLLRQHILLTLILRVSDPGAPSSSGGGCGTRRSLDNHLQLKSLHASETNPVTQFQMQAKIVIKAS